MDFLKAAKILAAGDAMVIPVHEDVVVFGRVQNLVDTRVRGVTCNDGLEHFGIHILACIVSYLRALEDIAPVRRIKQLALPWVHLVIGGRLPRKSYYVCRVHSLVDQASVDAVEIGLVPVVFPGGGGG